MLRGEGLNRRTANLFQAGLIVNRSDIHQLLVLRSVNPSSWSRNLFARRLIVKDECFSVIAIKDLSGLFRDIVP